MDNQKNKTLRLLRDPIWQGVAALLGVVAFIVSTIVAYDIYSKSTPIAQVTDLTVYNRYSYNLLEGVNKSFESRVKILIDDLEVEHLVIEVFQLENTGNTPITPSDFTDPIRIHIEEPWEILTIEIGDTSPTDLTVNWKKVDKNTYQLDPLLLNAQDSIEFLVYLNRPGEFDDFPEPQWKGRVVNVKSFTDEPPQIFKPQRSPFWYMQTIIIHSGWNVYFLVGLALLLFFVGIMIGIRSEKFSHASTFQMLQITILAGISFASADIITDIVLPDEFRLFYTMWAGSWVLLAIHLAFLIYLGYPIVSKFLKKK